MGVAIAEYFGQRTDVATPIIQPVSRSSRNKLCPFMNKDCAKISKGLKPVCSVRKRNGDIWIVCRDRLCSTNKNIPLSLSQNPCSKDKMQKRPQSSEAGNGGNNTKDTLECPFFTRFLPFFLYPFPAGFGYLAGFWERLR
jgi:hypothetical protein